MTVLCRRSDEATRAIRICGGIHSQVRFPTQSLRRINWSTDALVHNAVPSLAPATYRYRGLVKTGPYSARILFGLGQRDRAVLAQMIFERALVVASALNAKPGHANFCGQEVPRNLREIRDTICASRQQVDTTEFWDDGRAGTPLSEETWLRATELLWRTAVRIFERDPFTPIPAPRIDAVPDGSIDCLWRLIGRELLINVPHNNSPARYYGDDGNGLEVVQGVIEGSRIAESLLLWLLRE